MKGRTKPHLSVERTQGAGGATIKRGSFPFGPLRLSYVEAGPKKPKAVLLLAHANGFSAGCYSYYLRRLGKTYRVFALDFAGHGASDATLDFNDWNFFRDQILTFIEHIAAGPVVGLGHSLGGASLLRAAAVQPGLFRKVIALDPVVLNVPALLFMKVFGNSMVRQALARRAEFRSEALVERAFRRFGFHDEVFADFVQSCFRAEGGRVVLACPPAVEARVFSQGDLASIRAYGRLETEAHFLLPTKHRVCSPRAAMRMVRNNVRSSITLLPNVGHLFPLEEPELTLAQVERLLT